MKFTIIDVLVRGGGAVPQFLRDGVMTDADGSPFSHPSQCRSAGTSGANVVPVFWFNSDFLVAPK
jgi:hypothetical protein